MEKRRSAEKKRELKKLSLKMKAGNLTVVADGKGLVQKEGIYREERRRRGSCRKRGQLAGAAGRVVGTEEKE